MHPRRPRAALADRGRLALAAALLALAPGAARAAPQGGGAAELLAQARKLNDAGNYPAARELLLQVVRKFPGAPEAETAKELSADNAFLRVRPLEPLGPPQERVDVVVMAEG